jgi:hypothetical protein
VSEEAKVKRYLVAPLRLDQVVCDQSGVPYTSVVLASDYDALAQQLEEARTGRILTDKDLLSAVITAVMSGRQAKRDEAVRKLQRHIWRVEEERDALRAAIKDHDAKCACTYFATFPPTKPHNNDDSLNQKDLT